MRQKRITVLFLMLLAVCMLASAAFAEEGDKGTAAGPHTHDWQLSAEKSKPATCESPGVDAYVCPQCSETMMVAVPAKGHSWGSWNVTKAATCAEAGTETRTCTACGAEESRPYTDAGAHVWGEWSTTKEATCAAEGIKTRTCTLCGKQDTTVVAKTGEHKWGDWNTTRKPTCLASGIRNRTCSVCGKTETETIEKKEHAWSGWDVSDEPTCTKAGKEQRTCSLCGGTEKRKVDKLGHDVQEWNVTKEPTCRKTGTRTGTCARCGKEITETLPKTGHIGEEWEITEESTDFSKGKRQAACKFCGRKITEDFYPEGTLGRKLENDPETVRALQAELQALGLLKEEPTGEFDKATENAVKKAEKNLGVKSDGFAWPGVLKLLGVGEIDGKQITRDSAKYLLRLEVQQTSRRKDVYAAGDELKFEWVLTNSAKRSACGRTKAYEFDIKKAVKQKDALMENAGTLKAGESVSGEFVYTVTEEDAEAGRFCLGFTARGSIGGNAANSNTVMFVNAAGAGTADDATTAEDENND